MEKTKVNIFKAIWKLLFSSNGDEAHEWAEHHPDKIHDNETLVEINGDYVWRKNK